MPNKVYYLTKVGDIFPIELDIESDKPSSFI